MSVVSHSQTIHKTNLDDNSISTWCRFSEEAVISNDARYVAYSKVIGEGHTSKIIWHFKDLKTNWEISIDNPQTVPNFSDDSKSIYFKSKDDKLLYLTLGTSTFTDFGNVKSYRLVKFRNKQELFSLTADSVLRINHSQKAKGLTFERTARYEFSKNLSKLFVFQNDGKGTSIVILDLASGKQEQIFKGLVVTSFLMNGLGSEIVFVSGNMLWLWDSQQHLRVLIDSKFISQCIGFNLTLKSMSNRGNYVVLKLSKSQVDSNILQSGVDILSSEDPVLKLDPEIYPTIESKELMVDFNSSKILFETEKNEFLDQPNDDGITIVRKIDSGPFNANISNVESPWNTKGRHHDYILNVQTLTKTALPYGVRAFHEMSPKGSYIISQISDGGDIFLTKLQDLKTVNLTKNLPIPISDDHWGATALIGNRGIKVVGWDFNEANLLIKDPYDIWKVDPNNNQRFFNITSFVGRETKTVFDFFANFNSKQRFSDNEIFCTYLSEKNLDNGFVRVDLAGKVKPVLLAGGKYIYHQSNYKNINNMPPIKARDKNVWLVARMSAKESNNLFWTKDFKAFNRVSNIHPERNTVWLENELISYKTERGVSSEYILYKPENFDSTLKYPVLFTFYEQEALKLNQFPLPKLSERYSFNIPYMLSKGYLVCVPNIYFKIGKTAENIVDCVEGAAIDLAKKSYIDSKHFGVCGGSFGGYGVNCLAAFSNKFAALISISGVSELITYDGSFPNVPSHMELGQGRMGVSLSTDPKRYIDASPLIFAKNVKDPILIVNTITDWNVNVNQGNTWFTALRREGKPAWMLRYQVKTHGIPIQHQSDFSIRCVQFFDYYLKGSILPAWMK